MKYTKPALNISDQIKTLQQRGLIISDPTIAATYLCNISFYRLRAYTYPYQDNNDPNHPFTEKVTFEQIIELYNFDRKLRLLLNDAIEKIEIAFRTQIIYQWAITHGSHWHTDPSLFRSSMHFANNLASLDKEIKRANETFLQHYSNTYTVPPTPPAWMSLEVSSFGLLSIMFHNLKRGTQKKAVSKHFGLIDEKLLENWMRAFSDIRNICAHHSRLWNRRFTTHINQPKKTLYAYINNRNVYAYKLYPVLCAMVYILSIINPTSTFKQQLKHLIMTSPNGQIKEMGFPNDWQAEKFWQ